MNYKEAYVVNLIRERAREREERRGGQVTNVYAVRDIVPFPEWLSYTRNVKNWKSLKKYDLLNHYLDYRVDCVANGMMFQCGRIYGLDSVD